MITDFELLTRTGRLVGRGRVDRNTGRVHITWETPRPVNHPARFHSVARTYTEFCGGHGPNYRWRTVESVP